MPSSTSRYHFTYPLSGDATNVPSAVETPFDQLDAIVVTETQGVFASRPAASIFGRRYYATDTNQEFLDLGTVWISIGPINVTSGNIQQSYPGASVSSGSTGLAADAGHIHKREDVATSADLRPVGNTASAGTTGKWVDAGHVHPGGSSLGDLKYTANLTGYSTTPINGWLPADGRTLNVADYSAFYTECGGDANYPWGKNTVTHTFNLPNYVNRLPIGSGNAYTVGTLTGSSTVVLATANLPNHLHPITDVTHVHTYGGASVAHPNGVEYQAYINQSDSTLWVGGGSGTPSIWTASANGGAANYSLTLDRFTLSYMDPKKTGITSTATQTGTNAFANSSFSIIPPVAAALCLVKVQ